MKNGQGSGIQEGRGKKFQYERDTKTRARGNSGKNMMCVKGTSEL